MSGSRGVPPSNEASETFPPSEWDIVDEASLESFPASDPPAWGSYHAAPSESTVASPDIVTCPGPVAPAEARAKRGRRRRMQLVVGMVAALVVGAVVLLGAMLRRRH